MLLGLGAQTKGSDCRFLLENNQRGCLDKKTFYQPLKRGAKWFLQGVNSPFFVGFKWQAQNNLHHFPTRGRTNLFLVHNKRFVTKVTVWITFRPRVVKGPCKKGNNRLHLRHQDVLCRQTIQKKHMFDHGLARCPVAMNVPFGWFWSIFVCCGWTLMVQKNPPNHLEII